jgi:hypothetical protein
MIHYNKNEPLSTYSNYIIDKKPVYQTTKYPEVPLSDEDIYVYATQGDRFDVLAQQYYGDQSLWWIISIANTAVAGTSLPADLPQDSLIIPKRNTNKNPIKLCGCYKQIQSFK